MGSKLLFAILLGVCSAKSVEDTRIVGGEFAEINQFPHQVALLYHKSLRCGGSIISPTFILTASHCLVGDYEHLEVLAGTINLNKGGERRKVKKEIQHELYGNFKNDVALLLLEEMFTFSPSINQIDLQTVELSLASEVTIVGWGKTSNWGLPSSLLKYNVVKVSSVEGCSGLSYGGILCFGHEVNNGACNVRSEIFQLISNLLIHTFLLFQCSRQGDSGDLR